MEAESRPYPRAGPGVLPGGAPGGRRLPCAGTPNLMTLVPSVTFIHRLSNYPGGLKRKEAVMARMRPVGLAGDGCRACRAHPQSLAASTNGALCFVK